VPVELSAPPLKLIRPPDLDDDTDPEWTVAANVPNAIIGSVLKKQLEDAGIPVLMFRARSADIGEFTHNDFVPQELRVPRDRRDEARNLVYAAPGDSFGWGPWNDQDVEAEGEPAYHDGEDGNNNPEPLKSLPEGWSMLPTEGEVSARQQMKREHHLPSGQWSWSDAKSAQRQQEIFGSSESRWGDGFGYEQEPVEQESRYEREIFEEDYYPPGQAGPSKWVKVFYAILIGSLTIPFLFQLFGQIGSIFGGR
jgi:hypothetical protein